MNISTPPAATPPFKLLILEDSTTDAELELYTLQKAGLAVTAQQVGTESAFVHALGQFQPDVIIVDYQLPGFNGFEAAKIARHERADRPVILVTGVLNDDAAMDLIKIGISDYVLKDRLARLPAAVTTALADAAEIRARQKAEEAHGELARILECAKDAVIGKNLEGVITAWNSSAARIYGCSADKAIGRPIEEVLGNGYTKFLDYALRRVERDGEIANTEGSYRRNGKVLSLSLSLSAIRDAVGSIIGTSIIVRDITKQKQIELQLKRTSDELAQSLQQVSQANATLQREIEVRRAAEVAAANARKQAEQANSAKTSYMSHVSLDEIRTPMTSIIGFADLLLDSPLRDDQAIKVRNLREAARSLLSVINDVLDISGAESGRLKLTYAPTNIRTVVDGVVATLQPRADRKRLGLRWDVAADVPSWVRADPERLRQILLNLGGNALKFTEQGSVSISVARDPTPGGELILFEVTDTGIGIPRDKQDDLFSEFYRVNHPRGRDAEGSGLGLAISKRLVGIMGGSIGVKSREGEGSVFWFVLPLPSLAHEPAPEVVTEEQLHQRNGRILVAEDLPMNQMIIAEMLERAGHTVKVVADGMTATTALGAEKFDLVLMDVEMPVMGGLESTRAIRRMDSAWMTPIVALTANAMPQQIDDCRAAGMDDFVSKPIDRALLLYTVDKWIGKHTSHSRTMDEKVTDMQDTNLLEALEQRYGADRSRRFLAMARDSIDDVVGCLPDCQDRNAAAHALHDLVSVAGNIGLRDLSEQSRQLMFALRSGADDITVLATTVLTLAQAALSSIDRLLVVPDPQEQATVQS